MNFDIKKLFDVPLRVSELFWTLKLILSDKRNDVFKTLSQASVMEPFVKILTKRDCCSTFGTKYSRMGQVKFVEDSL